MTLADALKLMEPCDFALPGPLALASLAPMAGQRSVSLTCLMPSPDGACAWCNVAPVALTRKKYCSERCSDSAGAYCNPQCPRVKLWLLIHRQNAACPLCGLCFDSQISTRIEDRVRLLKAHPTYYHGKTLVSWHLLGYGTGDIWQVDHIVPLYKGGRGIGFENLQVICTGCHAKKTARDRLTS